MDLFIITAVNLSTSYRRCDPNQRLFWIVSPITGNISVGFVIRRILQNIYHLIYSPRELGDIQEWGQKVINGNNTFLQAECWQTSFFIQLDYS